MLKYMDLLTLPAVLVRNDHPIREGYRTKCTRPVRSNEDLPGISDIVGPGNMCWRYDQSLDEDLDDLSGISKHFRTMCKTLYGSTHTVVISFIDLYEKVKRNYPEVKRVPFQAQLSSHGESLLRLRKEFNMTVKPCGEVQRTGFSRRGLLRVYDTKGF